MPDHQLDLSSIMIHPNIAATAAHKEVSVDFM
jgi:hypothetical protein